MEIVGRGKKEEKETLKEAQDRRNVVSFKPRKANVLFDAIEVESTAKSIILPEGADSGSVPLDIYYDHPVQGIVVALGPDCGKMPLGNTGHTSADDLSVGDRVVLRSMLSTQGIRDKGHTYFLVSDHDVIGILEKA